MSGYYYDSGFIGKRSRKVHHDANHKEIKDVVVKEFYGSWVDLNPEYAPGLPDALVGFRDTNMLWEIKSKDAKLNENQIKFHRIWRGMIYIVRDAETARAILNATGFNRPRNGFDEVVEEVERTRKLLASINEKEREDRKKETD